MDLASHRFMSYFEPEQAAHLCKIAILENFAQETLVFEEGEPADFLYLVLEGEVKFSKRIDNNKHQTVALAKPDDFFGELGVLDGQPRSARALAIAGSNLAKISRTELIDTLHFSKGTSVLQIFSFIVQNLRDTTDQYVNQFVHKQKMVLVGEMVSTIIHDFKSPFTGIKLSSEMLKEIHPDEETQEWCDLIQLQVQRMLEMAEEVLEFSRGNSVLHKKSINLIQTLHQFEKLNRVYFEAAKVELVVRVTEVIVLADENKILRVLQNLVGNAVEAFGGRGGRVEITVTESEEWAEISIYDNGPGIPRAIKEKLFEPFVTYGKRTGTGLGTAIAKSMIDAHKGEITYESEDDKGTTFYIRLPKNIS
ncbi:MAG: cyclic nucleotide-binding protein [Oscillatoriales cyanobacterium]|uniref:histidine kinase n=1 Tax=Microcoleus anatoxicus PTRS2 TaxID=2705321 RepID=A0ABU8YMI9_9CYAN|nr:MAG: cyclic nucleotide-binding protein [Oscillatoriales cyanobacterium]TAD94786.1 MAG: cyclic nucleotide-binding protein [Oscillatoriales cyanobacterium]TAE02395.1 MAG: cyclic nucleotide-binding protein [Oscillatoriales cyanobacterium]